VGFFVRALGIRLVWAFAAVLVATVVLMRAFTEWRDTEYGNTARYLDKSDWALWGDALSTATSSVGLTVLLHVLLTTAVTSRYPVGRWAYWLSFFPVAAWATYVTHGASQPVSFAGFMFIVLPLAWVLSLICLAVGAVELTIRSSPPGLQSQERTTPVGRPGPP
jgi:hypothetical protein